MNTIFNRSWGFLPEHVPLEEEPVVCVCDPDGQESLQHVIVESPVFGAARADAGIEIRDKISKGNLSRLNKVKETRQNILEYYKETALAVIIAY